MYSRGRLMEVSAYEYITLMTCFLLSGFFSGSEAVLLSINPDRAKQLIEEGGAKGKAMQFMLDCPGEILTTILVGNNIVNIFASSLTTVLATRFFKEDAIGYAVGVTTFIILIFGEIIPKTFARAHAEKLSTFTLGILKVVFYLLYPVIKFMVWLIDTVLGENGQLSGRIVTKNDIEYMIQKAEKENTMDSKQIDMINSILEFPLIKVKDIMISRKEVKYIDSSWPFSKIMQVVGADTHSRYPVCDGELEKVIGFLHVKSLAFVKDEDKKDFKVENYLKEPFFVYEHMKVQSVFDHMNRKKVHLALVKDENGIVVGIITIEDIIEEILGEIQDEHDREDEEVRKEYEEHDLIDGINVEGTTSLRDLYSDYDIKIPLNDNYSTLAGFILDMLGNNFPEEGQIIVWEGLSFSLENVDDYEIREVKIKDVDGEKHLFSKKSAVNAQEVVDPKEVEA